jgi:hypothetical protein
MVGSRIFTGSYAILSNQTTIPVREIVDAFYGELSLDE